jgi:hypothetical protein
MNTLSTGARSPLLPGCPEASRDGTDNVPPASPTSKRPSPHESVRDRAGSPPLDRSLLSWASSPPEPSPSTPRSLNPPRPQGPEHRLRPESPATTQGTGSPQGQVQPSPTHTRVPVRSARRLPAPSRLARATPRWRLLLPRPQDLRALTLRPMTLGVSKSADSCVSPEGALALLGFLASSPAS